MSICFFFNLSFYVNFFVEYGFSCINISAHLSQSYASAVQREDVAPPAD